MDIKIRLSNLKHVYLDCFSFFTQELNLFHYQLSFLKSVVSFIASLSFNMYIVWIFCTVTVEIQFEKKIRTLKKKIKI